jgi:hypothetical protein
MAMDLEEDMSRNNVFFQVRISHVFCFISNLSNIDSYVSILGPYFTYGDED